MSKPMRRVEYYDPTLDLSQAVYPFQPTKHIESTGHVPIPEIGTSLWVPTESNPNTLNLLFDDHNPSAPTGFSHQWTDQDYAQMRGPIRTAVAPPPPEDGYQDPTNWTRDAMGGVGWFQPATIEEVDEDDELVQPDQDSGMFGVLSTAPLPGHTVPPPPPRPNQVELIPLEVLDSLLYTSTKPLVEGSRASRPPQSAHIGPFRDVDLNASPPFKTPTPLAQGSTSIAERVLASIESTRRDLEEIQRSILVNTTTVADDDRNQIHTALFNLLHALRYKLESSLANRDISSPEVDAKLQSLLRTLTRLNKLYKLFPLQRRKLGYLLDKMGQFQRKIDNLADKLDASFTRIQKRRQREARTNRRKPAGSDWTCTRTPSMRSERQLKTRHLKRRPTH